MEEIGWKGKRMVSSGEGRVVGMVEWKKCSWEVNGWVKVLKE